MSEIELGRTTTVDSDSRRAYAGTREVELTPTEFVIVEHLVEHPGWVVRREQLEDAIWGDADAGRALGVHVANLRKKLRGAGSTDVIECVRGVGYRLRRVVPPPCLELGMSPAGLVGREAELSIINTWLDSALAGSGRCLLLAGQVGYGKTHLALATATLAAARGAMTHWGRCDSAPAIPSLWPVVELLMSALGPVPRKRLRRYPRVAEFAESTVAGHQAVGPGVSTALLQELVFLMRAEAGPQGALLVIEDIDLADQAMLEVLSYVMPRLTGMPIAVLLTCDGQRPACNRLLRELLAARAMCIDLVALSPLSNAGVAELATQLLPARPEEQTVAHIQRVTCGNPAMVHYLCVAVANGGSLDALGSGIDPMMAAAISRRVSALPEPTGHTLLIACTLAPEFDAESLSCAADRPSEVTAEALEDAIALGYLEPVDDRLYRFANPQVRDSLRQS